MLLTNSETGAVQLSFQQPFAIPGRVNLTKLSESGPQEPKSKEPARLGTRDKPTPTTTLKSQPFPDSLIPCSQIQGFLRLILRPAHCAPLRWLRLAGAVRVQGASELPLAGTNFSCSPVA